MNCILYTHRSVPCSKSSRGGKGNWPLTGNAKPCLVLPVLQEHKEAQRNSANDVSSIKQRQVLQGKKLWLMYSPDDISMERLFEQAPLHAHPAGYEGATETTLGPLGSLTSWKGKSAKTTFPPPPPPCAQGCSHILQKVIFSRSPQRGAHTASLPPGITFLTPKTERSPSFLVSLLSDVGPVSFPSALRHKNQCRAL